jgi:circadian clock protein KaiC
MELCLRFANPLAKKMPKTKTTRPTSRSKQSAQRRLLPKAPTGINGLDEITGGGFPRGRPTLLCGGAGCGKTMLAMEFLARGALEFNEPGVFMSFEETAEDLVQNAAPMGFDLRAMERRKQLVMDHVRVDPQEIAEIGEFDLRGLFLRLELAIDAIGAKRVVLDTLEALFGGFSNSATLRAELRRLFDWLKQKKVTAVITAERGDGTLTRQGLEEYVSDCVILLDHRVLGQQTIRRLRVVKYRGSVHGTDEYPFLIGQNGITVLPITSLGLTHKASTEILPTGIAALDAMFAPGGFYRASTILVSGLAGAGKSGFAGCFVAKACASRERCLYVALEQSQSEIERNMRSIGVDLTRWGRSGTLRFHAARPTAHGLELHLTTIHKLVTEYRPRVVVVDSITSLMTMGSAAEVASMVIRLIDFLKMDNITLYMTSLSEAGEAAEMSGVNISSLVDTWILLRNLEADGDRVRTVSVLKARGMAHSSQTQRFVFTPKGIQFAGKTRRMPP